MDKHQVVEALEEIGTLLELLGENPFKTRAYENAVRVLDKDPRSVDELVRSGEVAKLKGFGKALVEKVTTLVTEGRLPYLEELRTQVPEGLGAVLRVPGLGPKKVRRLWQELGIESLAELEYACRENRLMLLKGFGEKSQAKALDGIRFLKAAAGRRLLADVLEVAEGLRAATAALPGVARAELAGSLRRRSPVVKDVDIVVATDDAADVAARLGALPGVEEVLLQGPGRTSVRVAGGLQVDWRLVAPGAFPSALAHFTGSKAHNVHLRQRAKERHLKLSEYGLEDEGGVTVEVADEADLYQRLGLAFVPPEMREDLGEVERAAAGPLPPLLDEGDLKGVLHLHTTRSDGADDLRAMALAARQLGYQYLGVTEHSKTAVYASGLQPAEIEAQAAEVAALNAEDLGIRILRGIESDILPDGSLDYPDPVLQAFDFVIGSVHSSFGMSEEAMTARLLTAMDNPWLDMIGHPTGRILLGRRGYALDMTRVLEKAAACGVIMEINASPSRLDLDYTVLPRARAMGVRFAVNPDAHSRAGLADTAWGVHTARKGGLTREDVVNALSADDFLAALRRHR